MKNRSRLFYNSGDLARAVTKSFDGSQPLTENQENALLRWKEFKAAHWSPDSHLESHHLPEIFDIFSHVFFLGDLPTDIKVRWESFGSSTSYGLCDRISIQLNRDCLKLFNSSEHSIRVLLHEMTHVCMHGCQRASYSDSGIRKLARPRRALARPRKLRSTTKYSTDVDDPDYGVSGHGAAFLHITKAIEEHMNRLLGISGSLGRKSGIATEILTIIAKYCHCGSLYEAEPLILPLLGEMAEIAESPLIALLLEYQDRSALKADREIVSTLEKLYTRRRMVENLE